MATQRTPARDLAWAAGFLDGEGWIGISVRRRVRPEHRELSLQYWSVVTCPQVDPRPLLALQRMFGGHLYLRKRQSERHADIYDWHLTGPPVAAMLRAIRPYFRVKGEQAEVLIDFQESLESTKRRPLTSSVLASREAAMVRLQSLNRNGVSKPIAEAV